jgi:hypothetical protein
MADEAQPRERRGKLRTQPTAMLRAPDDARAELVRRGLETGWLARLVALTAAPTLSAPAQAAPLAATTTTKRETKASRRKAATKKGRRS